jgi:hypothetical protein
MQKWCSNMERDDMLCGEQTEMGYLMIKEYSYREGGHIGGVAGTSGWQGPNDELNN